MAPDSVAALLKALPALFWPAVIAAIITAAIALLGVVISNRSNTKRLRIQLAHDSAEKSRERISQMRRSVYMQAAAEMSGAMAHLGNIPQLDPRTDDLTAPLLSFNSVAAQIQLIAESHTANLCAEMGKHLASTFFEMIAKAQPMFDLKIEAEKHASMRDFAQREFDQLIAKAKILNESPGSNAAQLEQVWQSINMYRERVETNSRSFVECFDKKLLLQKQYASELLIEIQPIVEAQIPLLVEIRKELELTSNVAEIRYRTATGLTDFKAMMDKALTRLSKA